MTYENDDVGRFFFRIVFFGGGAERGRWGRGKTDMWVGGRRFEVEVGEDFVYKIMSKIIIAAGRERGYVYSIFSFWFLVLWYFYWLMRVLGDGTHSLISFFDFSISTFFHSGIRTNERWSPRFAFSSFLVFFLSGVLFFFGLLHSPLTTPPPPSLEPFPPPKSKVYFKVEGYYKEYFLDFGLVG